MQQSSSRLWQPVSLIWSSLCAGIPDVALANSARYDQRFGSVSTKTERKYRTKCVNLESEEFVVICQGNF
jgi:hypothetical protein